MTATSGGRTLACKEPENLENNCNRSQCVFCRNLQAGISTKKKKKKPTTLGQKGTRAYLQPTSITFKHAGADGEGRKVATIWGGGGGARAALPTSRSAVGIALGAAMGIRLGSEAAQSMREAGEGHLNRSRRPGLRRGDRLYGRSAG